MERQIIFRNMDTDEQLTMPVTPESYDVEEGRAVNTLDMALTGEVNLPGLETLFNKSQNFWLPASAGLNTTDWQEPLTIVNTLIKWSQAGNVVRYIVNGSNVNAPCLIETVRWWEQDGTNDVYLTLTLKKYRYLTAETFAQQEATENNPAADDEAGSAGTSYTVVSGDCLWTIAAKYYGDGSLCYRLATYNGIKNPNLIYPGDVLEIPDAGVLEGVAATYPPAQAATNTGAVVLGSVNSAISTLGTLTPDTINSVIETGSVINALKKIRGSDPDLTYV